MEELFLNQFLTRLLDTVGIDIDHLTSKYLNAEDLKYLNNLLVSQKVFETFPTVQYGSENLECLLHFFHCYKEDIVALLNGNSKSNIFIDLYTSGVISGSYDCFRFDLSKFPRVYSPTGETLTLYRIGREGEHEGDLGCSWAGSVEGLNAYCDSSSLTKDKLVSRPIFVIEIEDSEVLFEGERKENEFVLKPGFIPKVFCPASESLREQVGR
ncbi:hypothetical protein [Vibrio paucivorans]|uniref:Uncharacterized protein n=1 Tax=Vibrio paucivorans TaxID=2829489 RepID=A0A9X3CJB8_9VIBR|nr:hypothetical protein [Vibrio paucivorans]MCW8336584.1 hypothetical protein [Vibrio paucivorans]